MGEPQGRSDAWAKWVLAVIAVVVAIGVGIAVATATLDRSDRNACEDTQQFLDENDIDSSTDC